LKQHNIKSKSLLKVYVIPIIKASSVNLTKGDMSPSEKNNTFTVINHHVAAEGAGLGKLS
jgi:hypothetical protein